MKTTKIIDTHIHMFPDDLPANWDWYAAQDPWFRKLTDLNSPSRVKEVFSNAEETLEAADRAGVERMFMLGWYWNSMELCRRNNDYMARLIERYPGRFSAFASIDPTFGEEAVREVYRCREMGFTGIGELGPGGNGYALDDPRLIAVLEAADELGMPVNFHVGEPIGHDYPGKDLTPISGFFDLAERFPNLTFIFAHLGGGLPFYELAGNVRRTFRNVYYDLAAAPLLYDIRAVRALIELVGSKKILFGSDYPLTLYPRKTLERDLSLFPQDIYEHAGLSDGEWNDVMRDNALRLLCI